MTPTPVVLVGTQAEVCTLTGVAPRGSRFFTVDGVHALRGLRVGEVYATEPAQRHPRYLGAIAHLRRCAEQTPPPASLTRVL